MKNNESKFIDISTDVFNKIKNPKIVMDSEATTLLGDKNGMIFIQHIDPENARKFSRKLNYTFSCCAIQNLEKDELEVSSEDEILDNICNELTEFQKENPNGYIHSVHLTPIFLENNDVRRGVVFKYISI